MADINIDFEIKQNNADQAKEAIEQAKARCLEILGLKAEGYAKTNITDMGAVDTGNLRNSITHDVGTDEVVIGTNVEYAPYVELGTRKMKARPFLRNAISENMSEYKAIIENELKA